MRKCRKQAIVTIPLPAHPFIRYPSPAMPNPIVHFEIPADDVQRAIKFYEQALGWKISDPPKNRCRQ